MLDPPFITCKYFSHYGSAMHSAKYVENLFHMLKKIITQMCIKC